MTNRRDSSDAKNLRPLHVVAGAMAMVLVVGMIDYVTGAQVSIAPLYLAPIAVATWFVSLRAGLLLCGLSAVIRLQDLWLTTHHFSHPLIPYWNGVVELGFFIVVALILSRLRSTHRALGHSGQDGSADRDLEPKGLCRDG
jgi:K+-sensing histidine kinase KdpD